MNMCTNHHHVSYPDIYSVAPNIIKQNSIVNFSLCTTAGDIFPPIWFREYKANPESEVESLIAKKVGNKFVLSRDERIEMVG